jgi:hypothetical protein
MESFAIYSEDAPLFRAGRLHLFLRMGINGNEQQREEVMVWI